LLPSPLAKTFPKKSSIVAYWFCVERDHVSEWSVSTDLMSLKRIRTMVFFRKLQPCWAWLQFSWWTWKFHPKISHTEHVFQKTVDKTWVKKTRGLPLFHGKSNPFLWLLQCELNCSTSSCLVGMRLFLVLSLRSLLSVTDLTFGSHFSGSHQRNLHLHWVTPFFSTFGDAS
jgi:hypothetical protein